MKLTYIGMNNGSIHEAHRLIEALRDTRDMYEDLLSTHNYYKLDDVALLEANLLASLEMVMRCDAIHRHPAHPVSPRLPSGAYLISQDEDAATFGGVLL